MSEGERERGIGWGTIREEGEGEAEKHSLSKPKSYFRRKSSYLGKIEGLDRQETGLGSRGA